MTLNIEVTPREKAWLDAQAMQQGVPAAEIVRQLINTQVSVAAAEEQQESGSEETDPTGALFALWTKEDANPGLDAKTVAAIAYLEARIEEGKKATPEEIRDSEEEYEELKRNLNANRMATDERLVFRFPPAVSERRATFSKSPLKIQLQISWYFF